MALTLILRLILGILLTFSGAIKIKDLRGFSIIVASYGILPRALVKPGAYLQPFVELFVGLWLLWGNYPFWAALAALAVLLAATGMVFIALLKKKKMENCGCYGTAIKIPLTWKKFGENLVWIALALWLLASL